MRPRRPRKERPPLDDNALHELALSYVGRFATTRAKLGLYLARKVRERGWGGTAQPPIEQLLDRFEGTGLIDDSAYALAKAGALGRRGYGERRVGLALWAAGVADEQRGDALDLSRREAVETAVRFARRRRLGPFADVGAADRKARDKALGAMLRAGHDMRLALAILALPPGTDPDLDELAAGEKHTRE